MGGALRFERLNHPLGIAILRVCVWPNRSCAVRERRLSFLTLSGDEKGFAGGGFWSDLEVSVLTVGSWVWLFWVSVVRSDLRDDFWSDQIW